MRAYNWESSPIGPADKWPQSFRTTLGILLNSKFPMFLYWGPDLICFYNDAYRFSLGNDGKHPLLLGMKGEEAFPETWHIVKPPIDQVLTEGEATWSEDQFVPIFREGEMKDAYWTFSFSPVKNESNQTAGVFLTLIETTEKVNNLKKLVESNDQLNFAIEATELGTWEFNPLTNKFIGNNRLKDWFGMPHEMEVDLNLAIQVLVEKDRSRVADAIQKALQYESGGLYDIEYGIIHQVTKQERIIRAKGRAWFRDDKTAYLFNGTLQDITEQEIAKKQIEQSEAKFRNLILQAPLLIATYKGPSFKIDTVNKAAIEAWGKSYEELINEPFFDVSPELETGLKTIFEDVYT
ncbi:MAG: PAS domain-containing protein, partial [Ferruginibacter sp.]|nr:PAS domain-containing protein [Ferruginibacter sp.]